MAPDHMSSRFRSLVLSKLITLFDEKFFVVERDSGIREGEALRSNTCLRVIQAALRSNEWVNECGRRGALLITDVAPPAVLSASSSSVRSVVQDLVLPTIVSGTSLTVCALSSMAALLVSNTDLAVQVLEDADENRSWRFQYLMALACDAEDRDVRLLTRILRSMTQPRHFPDLPAIRTLADNLITAVGFLRANVSDGTTGGATMRWIGARAQHHRAGVASAVQFQALLVSHHADMKERYPEFGDYEPPMLPWATIFKRNLECLSELFSVEVILQWWLQFGSFCAHLHPRVLCVCPVWRVQLPLSPRMQGIILSSLINGRRPVGGLYCVLVLACMYVSEGELSRSDPVFDASHPDFVFPSSPLRLEDVAAVTRHLLRCSLSPCSKHKWPDIAAMWSWCERPGMVWPLIAVQGHEVVHLHYWESSPPTEVVMRLLREFGSQQSVRDRIVAGVEFACHKAVTGGAPVAPRSDWAALRRSCLASAQQGVDEAQESGA